MGKATIIEAQNSETVFENGTKSGILGKLKGVFADYKHGTRNGDRLYTEELWDNRVFGSEDVMEALETKTLFGELDHPEGDRCETLAKNAAVSIIKLEKRPDEGVIYGEAEILDTPTGRIVKALADSGAKLGISSRGMGEEIFRNGQNIIDPETYDFITFDVVVTPANTKARVELTESKQYSKLTENIKREIDECETENQLNQVKQVVENINSSNKEGLLKMIEAKIDLFKQPIKDKSPELTEANRNIALNILKQKCAESKTQLDETLKASDELATENAKLIEKVDFLTNSRDTLKNKLKESNATILELKTSISNNNSVLEEANKKVADVEVKLEEANNKIAELNKKHQAENNAHREMLLRSRQVSNKKTESTVAKYNDEVKKLNETLAEKEEKINKLIESNKEKQDKLNSYTKLMLENKNLKQQVKFLEQKEVEHQNKLTESKLQESNKIAQLESELKELKQQNKKMEEAQDRFSKLSFNPIGTIKAVAENFENIEMDQEDVDLYNALIGN